MRRAHFVVLVSFSSMVSAALAQGCGSGSGNATCPPGEVCTQACPEGEVCTPAGDGGGGTTGDGSPVGPGSDSGGTVAPNCTGTGDAGIQASDDPKCNACANANCCSEVTACRNDVDCVALINCLSTCDPSDFFCQGECSDLHGPGTGDLTNVSDCIQAKCPDSNCNAAGDASADFDF